MEITWNVGYRILDNNIFEQIYAHHIYLYSFIQKMSFKYRVIYYYNSTFQFFERRHYHDDGDCDCCDH